MADTTKQRENSTSRNGEGVAAPLEPSPEIAGLRQWESDTGKPASCSEGNAYMDGFRDGKNHAAAVSKNLQEELARLQSEVAVRDEWLRFADAEDLKTYRELRNQAGKSPR